MLKRSSRSRTRNIYRRKRKKSFITRFRFFVKKVAIVVSTIAIILGFWAISSVINLGLIDDPNAVVETVEVSASATAVVPETHSNEETLVDLPPEITLDGDDFVKVDGSFENYVEPGYFADDEIDGDLSDSVQVTIEQINDYNYQIHYEVQDSSGNTVNKTRDVKVIIGTVCLTFDDGPSLEVTPQILDILKEKGVNATFFVIGGFDETSEKADLIKRENDEGNSIGFHGMVHEWSVYSNIDTLMNNFYQIENLVEILTGTDSKLVRFLGGTSNTISKKYCEGIMTEATSRVTEEGYTYVDWNVDSEDASSNNIPAEAIYNNVVTNLKPDRVNVVLMHDASSKQTTAEALSGIIDYCLENGYDIETLSTDMQLTSSQHHPQN